MHASKRILFGTVWLSLAAVPRLFAAADAPPTATPQKLSPILTNIVFDADTKTYNAKLGEESVAFKFLLTNTWTNEITVDRMETSCGCTVAKMPSYAVARSARRHRPNRCYD